jgi:hypothetical protein
VIVKMDSGSDVSAVCCFSVGVHRVGIVGMVARRVMIVTMPNYYSYEAMTGQVGLMSGRN